MKVKELINYLNRQDKEGEVYIENANENKSFEIEEVTNGADGNKKFTVIFIESVEG